MVLSSIKPTVEPAVTRVVVEAFASELQVIALLVTDATGLLFTGWRTEEVVDVLPAMSVVHMSRTCSGIRHCSGSMAQQGHTVSGGALHESSNTEGSSSELHSGQY